jgi:ubiquitin C-terminal hydrolase
MHARQPCAALAALTATSFVITTSLQGREVHETQCLGCETVTRTDVVFYHLSLAIEQHSSLTHCLRQFR